MAINALKDIVQRCHQRHEKPLRQRKTAAIPAVYTKDHQHQYTVYCAHRYPVMLHDLEQSHISFTPIGRAPWYDQSPGNVRDERSLKRRGITNWGIRRWDASWGIQLHTGIPSERDGARWHDLHFKYEAICAAPDAVAACIEALVSIVKNPLLALEKSGGLRFSCRVQEYLHPNTEAAKLYIYKDIPTPEHTYQRDVYLEMFGEEGHTRWDARYEILVGDLLAPPVVAKEVFFAPIDALRAKLHEPAPDGTAAKQIVTRLPQSLGSEHLDFTKETFLRRGFSYVRHETGLHYWTQPEGTIGSEDVLLSERDGVVWIRALTPDTELPTQPTPVTEVWNDTGIPSLIDTTSTPAPMKVKQVREDELSPLAIKRPSPVLRQRNNTENDEILQRDVFQIESIFDRGIRILGVITGIGPWDKQAQDSYFLSGGVISVNTPKVKFAESAEQYFQEQNMPSVAYWRQRTHLWEQVKDIPTDVRMKTPFQHGNVCEDPERCSALEEKGGDPAESICPQCPVYVKCQQRGYLSQFAALRSAKVQMFTIPQLFFDPQYTELVEQILKSEGETERLCVLNQERTHNLFLECKLSKNVMEEWAARWQGCALGNFAKTLLSALEIKGKPYDDAVKGIRAVMQTFEWQAETLIQQMCQVRVDGKAVVRGIVDGDTGKTLARFSIEFDGGAFAYIPLDNNAADKLRAQGLPVFPKSVPLNEDLKVTMPMRQAIELGILNTETAASIQEFPTVCREQDWTFWHQLRRFFAHYTRDTDAPIRWNGEVLRFWVPPVLHASVKRLLFVSSVFSEQHLRRVFPEENLETYWAEPIPWSQGNRVFQIRTGIYPSETILDYHNWSNVGISETGQRFLRGINAEINADLGVKHGIITNSNIASRLDDIAKKKNVCFVNDFQNVKGSDTLSETPDVIWVVGTLQQPTAAIWHRAQMLFGNDEEPLSYEDEIESGTYKDPRLQSIYEEEAVYSLTRIIGQAELDRLTDRRIVLITGLPLPNITDRPETSIFDWEDLEIAGGLDKLPEAIAIRERFEQERENLTAESSREEVQRVLGCSERQANRVLQRLRGGNIPRVPFRQQILSLLTDREKKTAELTAAIDGHPEAIQHELTRLVDAGEIVRVRRGVYALQSKDGKR